MVMMMMMMVSLIRLKAHKNNHIFSQVDHTYTYTCTYTNTYTCSYTNTYKYYPGWPHLYSEVSTHPWMVNCHKGIFFSWRKIFCHSTGPPFNFPLSVFNILVSGMTTGSSISTWRKAALKMLSLSKMFKGSGFHSWSLTTLKGTRQPMYVIKGWWQRCSPTRPSRPDPEHPDMTTRTTWPPWPTPYILKASNVHCECSHFCQIFALILELELVAGHGGHRVDADTGGRLCCQRRWQCGRNQVLWRPVQQDHIWAGYELDWNELCTTGV